MPVPQYILVFNLQSYEFGFRFLVSPYTRVYIRKTCSSENKTLFPFPGYRLVMQRFRVWYNGGMSHSSLSKKVQVTSGISRYTTRKRCITILYHAIENNARWKGWVYSIIAMLLPQRYSGHFSITQCSTHFAHKCGKSLRHPQSILCFR